VRTERPNVVLALFLRSAAETVGVRGPCFPGEDDGKVTRRIAQVEARLDRLGGDLSKNFRWIVGIQITTLITVVATLLGTLAVR
jgi:hypothetical protein